LWLKHLQEIVGTPTKILYEDGCAKIIFTYTIQKTVEIPEDALPKEVLKKSVGKRIGILNLDGKYRIRNLEKSAK
jgi:hypothetical protein